MSLFFITEEQKNYIMQLLYRYVDAAKLEKHQHKKEMDYHEKLMDLIINHYQEYPLDWVDVFNRIQSKYEEHRKKYEDLCLTVTSLELNIEVLLYTEVIE
jgi:hypothetical protein